MEIQNDYLQLIQTICSKLNNRITLAIPLGIGKPNVFVNHLYQYVKENPDIDLTICTALTLQKPSGKHWLEQRFIDCFKERIFGDYPDLDYELDRVKNQLPNNIKVLEFYFPPGKYLGNGSIQKNYISSNYTHVARDLFDRGVNLVATMVAKEEGHYSYSCNADVTSDLVNLLNQNQKEFISVMQVNQKLPFMTGQALIPNEIIDYLIDDEKAYYHLFAPPKMAVAPQDHMIGYYASHLVKDDGELQVGIGSLGDAVISHLLFKHKKNQTYNELSKALKVEEKFPEAMQRLGYTGTFEEGLFGATEMFVDGFKALYENGILKKKCFDHIGIQRLINEDLLDPLNLKLDDLYLLEKRNIISIPLDKNQFDFLTYWGFLKNDLIFEEGKNYFNTAYMGNELKHGHIVHGGFFLGNQGFYDWLKNMPAEERDCFDMRSVQKINQLYGHEKIDRLHRKNARFVNTCMMTTLAGAHVSDILEQGQTISGVGGQFNFVAMAQELPDGHSVLMMKSTRVEKGKIKSNIVFNYGHITVPKHMRDILVTEYGIAFLRGKTDEEVVLELLKVCDSRFQDELLSLAKKAGKISIDYQIPMSYRNNYPESYLKCIAKPQFAKYFAKFPFGTDLSEDELVLGKALKQLAAIKKAGKLSLIKLIFKSILLGSSTEEDKYLKMLKLDKTQSLSEKLFQKIIIRLLRLTN